MSQVEMTSENQALIEDIKNQPGIWKSTYDKYQMMSAWNKLNEKYGNNVNIKQKWNEILENLLAEITLIPRNEKGECIITPENMKLLSPQFKSLLFIVRHMANSKLLRVIPEFSIDESEDEDAITYDVPIMVMDKSIDMIVEPDILEDSSSTDSEQANKYNYHDLLVERFEFRSISDVSDEISSEDEENSMNHNKSIKLEPIKIHDLQNSAVESSNNLSQINLTNTPDTQSNAEMEPESSIQIPIISFIQSRVLQDQLSSAEKSKLCTPSTNLPASLLSEASTVFSPNDEDFLYLVSLYPYMKQLSSVQKLRVQMKLQQIVLKYLKN